MITVSIITPFYYGNKYLERLVTSVNQVALKVRDLAAIEMIIVNDSPDEHIILPKLYDCIVDIRTLANERNIGIQGTRLHGLEHSNGEWVVFLDQDDELVPDGYRVMIEHCNEADVIVGNLLYEFSGEKVKFYSNEKIIRHSIKYKNFITIRNMIPSPGHCLIRKKAIPDIWKTRKLTVNGSDDYLLWLLMFKQRKVFKTIGEVVYTHKDNNGLNLSADIEKMYNSSLEMCQLLQEESVLESNEQKLLEKCVRFKYHQDASKLTIGDIANYMDIIIYNLKYKVSMWCYLIF